MVTCSLRFSSSQVSVALDQADVQKVAMFSFGGGLVCRQDFKKRIQQISTKPGKRMSFSPEQT